VSAHPDPVDVGWLLGQVRDLNRTLARCEAEAAEARWFRAAHIADLRAAGVSLAMIGSECGGVSKQTVHQWATATGAPPPRAEQSTAPRAPFATPRPL